MKYCLPIQATSTRTVDDIITNWNTHYDAIELWLDLLNDLTLDWLKAKIAALDASRLIFLFRRPNLAKPLMAPKLREAIFSLLIESRATIDLDIGSQQGELQSLSLILKRAANPQFRLLTSYHNYTTTPPDSEIREIYSRMLQSDAGAVKFSTWCQSERDALRLLQWLLTLRTGNKPFTVLGMGPFGQVTRIFGSLWGNELLFAPPLECLASAPGQLTLGDYKDIFSKLGGM